MLGYESKANEHYWDDKTFTCDKCGKVGTDFVEMAKELCPADVGASHQIPIFGDRKTSESKSKESSPDEVWCDLNNQWEDETSHKDHIKKQFGENEDEVDWEDEFKKQARDKGYGDALDSGQLSITTFPSDFFSSKKKRKKKGSKASESDRDQYDRAHSLAYDLLLEKGWGNGQNADLHDVVFNYMENIEGEEFKDPEYLNDDAVYQGIGDAVDKYLEKHGANEDFKEEEHPRKDDGKFTSKGSGSSSSNGDDKEEDIDDGYTEEDNKKYYDRITQNTLETLTRSKVNGFPFFSYIGKPKEIYKDGKGGVILFGMKRNPNSIRKIDIKYDEGRDTYSVSFTSNRNKPKGEYHHIYFDQLSDLIAGKGGLGVESIAKEDFWVDPAGYSHTEREVERGAKDTWNMQDADALQELRYLRGEDDFDDERIRRIKRDNEPYSKPDATWEEWMGEDAWKSQDFGWQSGGESIATEVDNSMDLGLLSGDTVVDTGLGLYDEQCPICGKDIDNNFMDYHMEQDHGVHSPSQYTQDTISQSMGDPNYDHLEDWRTSYGESKKIANEDYPDLSYVADDTSDEEWVSIDIELATEEAESLVFSQLSNEEVFVFLREKYGEDFTRRENRVGGLSDEQIRDVISKTIRKFGIAESKASEGMAENIWSKWNEATSGETVIWEDWREFAIDEGLTDKQIQEQYEKHWGVTDKEPVVEPAEWNSLTQGETPYGLGYESEQNLVEDENKRNMKFQKKKKKKQPYVTDTEKSLREREYPNISQDVWDELDSYPELMSDPAYESEGADEPEYYDDIPEEKFPTDFKLEDVKEEDVVVENRKLIHSSPTGNVWEDENGELSDDNGNYIPDHNPDFEPSEVSYAEDWEQQREEDNWKKEEITESKSKAEEAFNRGASAEEIYSLVDTKESEDDRTQSEDDYLTNLYNKTTANKSAGFIDI